MFAVSIGLGLVVGGIAALFFPADTDERFVTNLIAGGTLGSMAGALIGTAVWLAATVAGA